MKVLFIQGVSRYGGALKSLFHTMRLLKESGYYPVLVTSREGKLTQDCSRVGIKYYTFPIGMWRKVKTWPFLWFTIYRLVKLALRERVEVVHCNTVWDAPYGLVLGWILKKPVVVHLRNEHSRALFDKYYVRFANAIIGVSFACLNRLSPEERRKARVIYNPKETFSVVKVCSRNLSLAIVGRVDTTKGQIEFIEEVFRKILEKANVCLYVVGEASRREKFLERKMLKYKEEFKGSLIYTGAVSDVERFYSLADIVVIPSKLSAREGLPRVAIEAATLKRAIVATDSGGTREIIFEKTGVIRPSLEYLFEPILGLLNNACLRKKLSVNSGKFVNEKFSEVFHVSSLDVVYKGVLEVYG
ncbi:glycosyl transferase, group 1 [Thermosulfidibacter takaii ABI70S6]|uniref:Glycosyl transferase, group 1 n=1 Tax=Thermosulfidibacter takaii (strain DSM 17441 / JCM 13301 / NBRC 103674 / ABI70S6) TaxID=1298851 RepID=A0A0S3QS36_THET7|nr:glycosyltransferase [Thermosulfidibacter takaii]BAT71127.1 glycosyl transferase, group 1 [Thermosulfidibacter takaii ABI70S6]